MMKRRAARGIYTTPMFARFLPTAPCLLFKDSLFLFVCLSVSPLSTISSTWEWKEDKKRRENEREAAAAAQAARTSFRAMKGEKELNSNYERRWWFPLTSTPSRLSLPDALYCTQHEEVEEEQQEEEKEEEHGRIWRKREKLITFWTWGGEGRNRRRGNLTHTQTLQTNEYQTLFLINNRLSAWEEWRLFVILQSVHCSQRPGSFCWRLD